MVFTLSIKKTSNKLRFQLPSARNHFCEMTKINEGYKLTFFNQERKIRSENITEAQLDREFLRKIAVSSGIEFYALTGPYDVADEILNQWHENFKRKGLFSRLFGL